jgi:hypothetical protein
MLIEIANGAAHPQITPAAIARDWKFDKRLADGATLFWLPTIVDSTYLSCELR